MSQKRSPLELEGMKIEERMVRALEKALPKIRRSIPAYKLTAAIKAKDIKRAMSLIDEKAIADALTPCVAIAADAVAKGGKIVADEINR